MELSPTLNAKLSELFPKQLQDVLATLHREMAPMRQELLQKRIKQQDLYNRGEVPKFVEKHPAHAKDWRVREIPVDLRDRRVEITGPISSTKMVINMLSETSDGEIANMAMLDFEDSMRPTWENVIQGHVNFIGVARGDLKFVQSDEQGQKKTYELNPQKMAHPMVRIRGLHMDEVHHKVDGQPIGAGLFDLAVAAFHTAKIFVGQKRTPKFYVPKIESHVEARYWDRLFARTEELLDLPEATLRLTFLIETLPAAFEMEEILFESRNRVCALNVGRWDKIFSDIKVLRYHKDRVLADRASIDMKRPWMENYAKLLIKTCHARGAFAMGGMAAFTPGKTAETRELQTKKVAADKQFEASLGHDGCWVSHPYFIAIAKKPFAKTNQLDVQLEDFPRHPNLLPEGSGPKTLAGLRTNLRVGIAYQQGWDRGLGAIAFDDLMEDLATLEISRAQVWQWLHHAVKLDSGETMTPELVTRIFEEECNVIIQDPQICDRDSAPSFLAAMKKIRAVFLAKELAEFFS